jgi:hypothetical protein
MAHCAAELIREDGSVKRKLRHALLVAASITVYGISMTAPGGSSNAQDRPVFRVGVETVFVKVSVTDPLNRYVTGLEKEHFKVFEDKVEQSVTHFTQQSAPISVGILWEHEGQQQY